MKDRSRYHLAVGDEGLDRRRQARLGSDLQVLDRGGGGAGEEWCEIGHRGWKSRRTRTGLTRPEVAAAAAEAFRAALPRSGRAVMRADRRGPFGTRSAGPVQNPSAAQRASAIPPLRYCGLCCRRLRTARQCGAGTTSGAAFGRRSNGANACGGRPELIHPGRKCADDPTRSPRQRPAWPLPTRAVDRRAALADTRNETFRTPTGPQGASRRAMHCTECHRVCGSARCQIPCPRARRG